MENANSFFSKIIFIYISKINNNNYIEIIKIEDENNYKKKINIERGFRDINKLQKFIKGYDIVVFDESQYYEVAKILNLDNNIIYLNEISMIINPHFKAYDLKSIYKNLVYIKEQNYSNCEKMILIMTILIGKSNILKNTIEPLYFKIESMFENYNIKIPIWNKYLKYDEVSINEISYYKYNYKQKKKSISKSVFDNMGSYEELLKDESIWESKKGFIYEFRKGQYDLCKYIRNTIESNDKKIACIEAPTGIGKSVGYLLPAIIESYFKNKRIIVSTDTKELQTQLIYKDIPNILNSLGLKGKITYGYIKGKSNYICHEKLNLYLNEKQDSLNRDDLISIIYINSLIEEGLYGDIEEISEEVFITLKSLRKIINKIICDPNMCRPKSCGYNCLYKNRVSELKEEQITVINHSLLAKWPYKEEKPLENIIVDEAHNLIEKGYDFFSSTVESYILKSLLLEVYPYENIEKLMYGDKYKSKKIKTMDRFYNYIYIDRAKKDKISANINMIYDQLYEITNFGLIKNYDKINKYNLKWEINLQQDSIMYRQEKSLQPCNITYKEYSGHIKICIDKIISNLVSIILMIEKHIDDDSLDKESNIYIYGKSQVSQLEDIKNNLEAFLENVDDDNARAVEIYNNFQDFEIKIVPLKLSKLFEENILSIVDSAVFLSATLTVNNRIDYFKNTLGINNVNSLDKVIDSIYDYKSKVKIYAINDMAPYRNDEFTKEISELISKTSKYLDGKTLSLYNSTARKDSVYNQINKNLLKYNIQVYDDKKSLKKLKNKNNKCVLLGSKGFFEGVDIPGDSLTCVTLDKLPNINPNDPVYFSIMKKYNVSYHNINYPQMIIKLKQAMGRIIRSKYDYGVFIIFDIGRYINNSNNIKSDLHNCDIVSLSQFKLLNKMDIDLKVIRKVVFKHFLLDTIKFIDTHNIDLEEKINYIKSQISMRNLDIKTHIKQNDDTNIYLKYFDDIYKIKLSNK